MSRGPQFPLVNHAHFGESEPDLGGLRHTSQHGEYHVEHDFHFDGDDPSGSSGYGVVRVKHPDALTGHAWDRKRSMQTVATLKYDLESMPRATSLRQQPLTHTEYIDVDPEHQGRGLTHIMQQTLQTAHPGAPNIASNELTGHGAQWRAHLAQTLRDPGMGQRIGWYTSEDQEVQEHRVFRPAPGQPSAALHDPGEFSASDHGPDEFDDRRLAKKRKS